VSDNFQIFSDTLTNGLRNICPFTLNVEEATEDITNTLSGMTSEELENCNLNDYTYTKEFNCLDYPSGTIKVVKQEIHFVLTDPEQPLAYNNVTAE